MDCDRLAALIPSYGMRLELTSSHHQLAWSEIKQLVEIAKQLDAGHLRAFVKTTVPLNEASAAYSGAVRDKSGYGKIVIAVPA
jgi:NADPH:quinone reductase-like Zn-dependent oxidoreductase